MADEAANSAQFTYNQLVNTGQCGIGSGTNQLVDHNKVFETNPIWDGGGCGTPTLGGDTWDLTAFKTLNPPSTTMPPPLIPPAAQKLRG